jgi:hypothetical protein
MAEILGRCGFRCDLCAARTDDLVARQVLVEGWKKFFGLDGISAEEATCGGCREGTGLCKECPIRLCVIEKGIETCAHCDEFICDKLEPALAIRDGFLNRFGDISEEEYHIWIKPFESYSRLMEIRKSLGKT